MFDFIDIIDDRDDEKISWLASNCVCGAHCTRLSSCCMSHLSFNFNLYYPNEIYKGERKANHLGNTLIFYLVHALADL